MASPPSSLPPASVSGATGLRAFYEKLAGSEKKFVLLGKWGSAWLLLVSCLAALGCSSGEPPPAVGGKVPGGNYATGPCSDGQEYRCSATLEQANGVLSCWTGIQLCEEGTWGPCIGELTKQADPRPAAARPGFFDTLALSAPEPCIGNPCDPSCQVFNEDPDDMTPDTSVPNWTSPPGEAPCEHQLCEEGTGLDPTCHPCVARVCAADETCCSDGWTSSCIDLVYSECGPPPPTIDICDFAVFAKDKFRTEGGSGSITGGPIGAGSADSDALHLNNVTVQEVMTPGSVILDNTTVIDDVTVGGTITKRNTVVIGGTETTGAVFDIPTLPTKELSCLARSGSLNLNGGTTTIDPGDTREMIIGNGSARLILSGPGHYHFVRFQAPGTIIFAQPGTYTFDGLHFGGNNPTILLPPTGIVNIDTCSHLHFDNAAQAYTHDGDPTYANTGVLPDPLSLQWYTNATYVKIGPGALASGVMLAPNARVEVYGNASLQGLIYSAEFKSEPGVHIDASGLVGEACRDAGVGLPVLCPVTLDIPELPPALNEPCLSGLDCQVNTRCVDVSTDESCAHSKCLEGEPLDATCDPCVRRICEEDPTCCTTAWTPKCVAQVKTVCDAWCGGITSGCAHGVCSAGGPLTDGCDACVSDVCATPGLEYCCTTEWDSACIATAFEVCGSGLPPEWDTCEYAVLTGSAIVANEMTTIRGGDVGAGAGSSPMTGWGTTIEGNVYVQGSLSFNGANITGDVRVGGSYSANQTNVGGTLCGPSCADVPSAAISTETFTCPTGGPDHNAGGNDTLAPGTYGQVTRSGGTLTLEAGDYYLQSLDLRGQLVLPTSGTVRLFICDRARFNSQVSGVAAGEDALRFQVYSAATQVDTNNCSNNAVCIERGVRGVFTAPAGGAFVANGVRLDGLLRADTVIFRHGSTIDASGAVGSACREALAPCPVAVPPPTVAEEGSCVDNAPGFTDGTCGTPDLAVNLACSEAITVCNHGTVDAPAGIELTFFPRSGQQFATTTPDLTWAVGGCTLASAVPAGGCVTQSCDASLLDQDMTILVNGNASLAECSALDNWSMYVHGGCGGGQDRVTEIYEAVCPYATSPRWGLLAWETTTPGDSSIVWQARVADTEAALATQPFTELGTARSAPFDTQSCPLTSASSQCPVDVTEAFWGEDGQRHQPSFLELQVDLQVSGSDAPILHDWKITYSCLYDE